MTLLLELYNRTKNEQKSPSNWKKGRLILIHKKGKIENITNYRPLTIVNAISSIYTKVLNKRLIEVVEHHKLLGEIQGGFRQDRSSNDLNFILNTIIWKQKRQNKHSHIAFIDLVKAYDKVNREILFKQLHEIGKKFIGTIKSLYTEDNITTKIKGNKSRTIYLDQGVRQGCSLSPLLFALYLKDIGETLHESKRGTTIV